MDIKKNIEQEYVGYSDDNNINCNLNKIANNDVPAKNKPNRKNILEFCAEIISMIFTPLIIPTYAVCYCINLPYIAIQSSLSARIMVSLAILCITCMIPIISIAFLYKYGKISDPGVNQQKDRLIPYIITIISYIVGAIYLTEVNAPKWIPMFLIGGGLAAITSLLINLKWKISAHGAGMGGLVALFFTIWANEYAQEDYMLATSIVILLTGLVGTSRLILKRHTLGQVLAGTINGFFWVFLMTI